jgi:ribosome maturation factor RimP
MQIPENLQKKIGEIVADFGFIIFDIKLIAYGPDKTLRILIDAPYGGITINECAQVNRELSSLLDEEAVFGQSYTVEVSSPGMDWPLKEKRDFQRVLDKKLRLFVKTEDAKNDELIGILKEVKDDSIILDIADQGVSVTFDKINKAEEEF